MPWSAAPRCRCAGALAIGADIGGARGDATALAAKQAFVDGLNLAAVVGSVVVFVAAFVSWKLLPRTTPAPSVSPPRDEDPSVARSPRSSTETPATPQGGLTASGEEFAVMEWPDDPPELGSDVRRASDQLPVHAVRTSVTPQRST